MKKWKKYLITIIIFLFLAIIFFFIQNSLYDSGTDTVSFSEYLYFLSNGFSVSGILSICSAGLYYTASEGSFDGIAYASIQIFTTLFRGRKYNYSYSDYKIKMHREKRISLRHLLIVGIVYVLIGFSLYLAFVKIS